MIHCRNSLLQLRNKSASSFILGLSFVKDEMEELLSSGYISIKSVEKKEGKLQNLSFCFTGELEKMNRKEAEKLVKEAGGIVKSSVTKDLTYLVTNTPDSGSSKNKKALTVGCKIITENEFYKLLGDIN